VANKQKTTRKTGVNHSSGKRLAEHDVRYDVVIVGAGPAGSTLAWKLALEGLRTIVLDGARFPREKVCGDYIEPRGLRILDLMGCLETLEVTSPLPITYSSTYVDGRRCYIGRIPFYGVHKHLPKYGYIVPRDVLDNVILQSAVKAGATAHQETYVTDFSANRSGVTLHATYHGERVLYRGRIIVGADGVNSIVARRAGLLADDPRYIALSQRAYADGYEGGKGEAAFFFDADFFPGYGWMFPMSQGRVNLGVGVLKETCQRNGIAVPRLFREFFERLRRSHPRCRKLKLLRPPIGGIVKTYGGSGPNYFNNGLLIGDAGCFVDPMTGEGITPAMESALIAARIILDVLPRGRLDAKSLSVYENEFRKYFDPSMIFVDLCAATLRNPHYWGSWKRALERGCAFAQKDSKFAATSGACFGGLEVNPSGILAEMWVKAAESLLGIGLKSIFEITDGRVNSVALTLQEMAGWMNQSWASLINDPFWHVGWTMDVQRKWVRALSIVNKRLQDPRIRGVV
jgi:menaquinone-9 beta-reductase